MDALLLLKFKNAVSECDTILSEPFKALQ